MPRVDGLQLLEQLQKRRLPADVIITTGFGTIDHAVQAMRMGAARLLDQADQPRASTTGHPAPCERALQDEVSALREKLHEQYAFHSILSKSARMHDVFELISHVAQTISTVLIVGETGTGKELVARAVHDASPRRDAPFVAVNCAALPESLLESELFGHEKGAFTRLSASGRAGSSWPTAARYSLTRSPRFPSPCRPSCCGCSRRRRFERVGGSQTMEIDVRVVAATNRDLLRLAKEGKFREDLYYRLNVVKIDLPPLHDAPRTFPSWRVTSLRSSAARAAPKVIAPEAMETLIQHRWPGNIRELENAIERACVTSRDDVIRAETLPSEILKPGRPRHQLAVDLARPLTEQLNELTAAFEERYIRRALKRMRGHIGRTARLTGLSRRTITEKLTLYQIDKAEFKKD